MFYIYLTTSLFTIYFLEWKGVLLTDAQHEKITLTTASVEAPSDNKVEIFSCVQVKYFSCITIEDKYCSYCWNQLLSVTAYNSQ